MALYDSFDWPTTRPNPTGAFNPRPPGLGPGVLGTGIPANLGLPNRTGQTIGTPDGMVTFHAGSVVVSAWLDSESWSVNAGDGQIERVEIPRRTSRTMWRGREPITMQGPVVITGGAGRFSIEDRCRALDEMMGRGRRGTPTEPPEVIIDAGGAIPYDVRWQPDVRWWVEAIEWGTQPDEVYRRNDWHRFHQKATVQVVQVVRPALNLKASSAGAARDRLRRDTRLTTVVKSGETLRSVAKRVYGDTSRWEDIARLNNLRSPKVRAGRTLRLP